MNLEGGYSMSRLIMPAKSLCLKILQIRDSLCLNILDGVGRNLLISISQALLSGRKIEASEIGQGVSTGQQNLYVSGVLSILCL